MNADAHAEAQNARANFVIWSCVLFCLLCSLGRLALVTHWQLWPPFDLFFETPNLGIVQALNAGFPLYSPTTFNDGHFLITVYNPLFFKLVSWLPQDPANPFFTGRVLSLCAMCGIGVVVLVVGWGRRYLPVSLLGVAWFFLMHQPLKYAAFFRHDGLGVLFSLLSMLALLWWHSLTRRKAVSSPAVYTALFFVVLCAFLAFLTKQTFLSAGAAAFWVLLLRDRRHWVVFCVFGLAIFGGFAAYASLAWGRGYWFIAYQAMSQNPMQAKIFLAQWTGMFQQPAFVLLLLGLLSAWWWGSRRDGLRFWSDSPFPLYALFSLLALLVSVGKYGSDKNYFLELMAAAVCLLVWVYREMGLSPARQMRIALVAASLLCVVVVYELAFVSASGLAFTNPQQSRHMSRLYQGAEKEIRALLPKGGKIVSLNTHVISLKVQQPGMLNDTFAYWLLWNTSVLDVAPFLRSIREKRYDLILLQPRPYLPVFMPGHVKQVAYRRALGALRRHYQLRSTGAFFYFTPRREKRKSTPSIRR